MSKIYEIHPGWMSKSEIAYKLGVSERTIYARWKRGELLRKEIQGQVLWAELPEEGRKEAEEGPSVARFHVHSEGFGSRGSWSSPVPKESSHVNELVSVLERKNRSIEELNRKNNELRTSLEEMKVDLTRISTEKERLLYENEILWRVVEKKTLFQSFVSWLKNFIGH